MSLADSRRKNALSLGSRALQNYEHHYLPVLSGNKLCNGRVDYVDPSTGKFLWDFPNLTSEYVDAAVVKAKHAQYKWMRVPASEKGTLLHQVADALEEHKEQISELLALETGKAIATECRGEVALMLSIIRYFAGLGHEIKGRSIQAGHSLLGYTSYHPWGVVAGIVPWNVPLMFMAYKTATPLMAGNTVIIKIPEQASATLCFCLEIIRNILPDNIIHFLTGRGKDCGHALISHSGIDKISFTGSVETGRLINSVAANNFRPVSLELGGKSPMIVLEDCEPAVAIKGMFDSMRFTRAGQSCTAASRIYVPKEQLEMYHLLLAEKLNNLVIGDPLDDETSCGPVVSSEQQVKIHQFIDKANADGLIVDAYGIRNIPKGHAGWYVNPHVINSPDISHTISQEEIFGPVVTLTGYNSLDEAISLANSTRFGLSASVWGKNINQCLALARDFRSGIVQINQNAVMLPGFSYGGLGVSGRGKESSLEAMLETYMYEKTNIVNFG